MIGDILLQSNPMEKSYSVVLALTQAKIISISASLVLIPMALSIQLLEITVKKYNPSVHLLILDNLLQSNPMEKSYSVVLALTEAN
jgi:hypothetical protein